MMYGMWHAHICYMHAIYYHLPSPSLGLKRGAEEKIGGEIDVGTYVPFLSFFATHFVVSFNSPCRKTPKNAINKSTKNTTLDLCLPLNRLLKTEFK
jgi:hypothetical protein